MNLALKLPVKRVRSLTHRVHKFCLHSSSAKHSQLEANGNKYIQNSSYGSVPVVTDPFPDFIWQNLHLHENFQAFKCAATGRSFTHGQVHQMSLGLATALKDCNPKLEVNDVVAIALPNIPEFAPAFMGIISAGMVPTLVNPAFTQHEILTQLQNCRAKAVITSSSLAQTYLQVKSVLPDLSHVIAVGDMLPKGAHSLRDMMQVTPKTAALKRSECDFDGRDATLCVPFSSGTTGPPKGVVLTHSNLATNMLQQSYPDITPIKGVLVLDTGQQERILGVLPFYHIFGLNVILTITLLHGCSCVTMPKFDAGQFIRTLGTHMPTVLHLVPPLINFMVNSKSISSDLLSSVEIIVAGGASVGATLITKVLEKARKEIRFQEGYGMTELSPVSHLTPPSSKNRKIGSIGQVMPSTEAKIVDLVSGVPLPKNVKGELCVRGPQVMKGYFENPQITEETLSNDGWLKTGDVAYYDDDGYFYIVDRIKELIKVKGNQVSPSEIEDLIRTMSRVTDCAVVGVPSKSSGELPKAFVVKNDANLTPDDVHAHLQPLLSSFKLLAGGVEFVDEIPRAQSGKILRKELKERLSKHKLN